MHKKLFLYFLTFFTVCSVSAQECSQPKPNQRDLIILPDIHGNESVELFGVIETNESQIITLRRILESQSAPFLVELSIWKRLFKHQDQALKNWFNALDFQYYQFGNYLLCIPANWKKQFSIDDTALGFNIKNGTKIIDPLILQPGYLEPAKGLVKGILGQFNIYTSLVAVLKTLLNTDYAWNIVVHGHGGGPEGACALSIIAGMPYVEFKKLLQFLEKEVKTNILLYATCYAGGEWLLKAYETNGKPDKYSFPIILAGITDAPYNGIPSSKIIYDFFENMRSMPLCTTSLNQLGLSAGVMLQALAFNTIDKTYKILSPNNILQIRWPGDTRFNVMKIENLVESATQKLQQQEKLDTVASKKIIDAIKVTSRAFVVDKPFIDKTLTFSSLNHIIASSIPNKWHYIKGVLLTNDKDTVDDFMGILLGYFHSIIDLKSSKVFLIDHVNNVYNPVGAHKVMIFLNNSTPSKEQKTSELFYTIGSKGYQLPVNAPETIELDAALTKQYVKLFDQQKKKLFDEYNS